MTAADQIIVPRDPTPEMVEAGRKAFAQGDAIHVSHARVLWIWMDMLDAFELQNARGAVAAAPAGNNVAMNTDVLHASESRSVEWPKSRQSIAGIPPS